MEIERKFLVKALPEEWERYPRERMEQAYLCTEPVVRIRRSERGSVLTCKGPGLLSREEHEIPLPEGAFEKLLSKAEGNVIRKDRFRIPWAGRTIELDVFAPPLAPLVMAEVEFPTEAEAASFRGPDWFGAEVTMDPAYTNARLAFRSEAGEGENPGKSG